MARSVGLSRYHFLRTFKRETGLSPHMYRTLKRVEAARKLLLSGMPGGPGGFGNRVHRPEPLCQYLSQVLRGHSKTIPCRHRIRDPLATFTGQQTVSSFGCFVPLPVAWLNQQYLPIPSPFTALKYSQMVATGRPGFGTPFVVTVRS